jgi:hypothetical protein
MQDPDRRDDINLQAPRFLIACTAGPCPRCGAVMPLYALALAPGHRVLEPDDAVEDEAAAGDEASADRWRVASNNALLFHVEFVTHAVRSRLESLARSYRPSAGNDGDADAALRWANHCASCGATIDDEELFCEPGVGFQPTTAAGAARIRLVAVECPFAAVAAGYVPEPAYFDAMA